MTALGPCRGAHRACPYRATATVLAGSRAMCERCAADRRAARNRRKSAARRAPHDEARTRIAAALETRDGHGHGPGGARPGAGRPPVDPGGSVEIRVRVTQEQAAWLASIDAQHALGGTAAAVRWAIDRARR